MRIKLSIVLIVLVVSLVAASSASGQATIVINPGTGFNDPTPVAPVGGNNGTTLGEQRLIAVQAAADIWEATLNSGPTITVEASWVALPCEADAGTLASAGPTNGLRDFPNAPFSNTWYPDALANALSGNNIRASQPEITARFNINIGTSGCLSPGHWYLGLDGNHGSNGIDLVAVVLHEFAHGLGFQTFTDPETGNFARSANGGAFPSVWDRFLRDNSTGKLWIEMTPAERVASAINNGNLVWAGPNVTASVPSVLSFGADSSNRVRMFAPNPLDDGSSVSHFDQTASPNLLMEPNITPRLEHEVAPPFDLTLPLFRDIGWNSATPPPPSPTPTPSPPPNDNFAAAQVLSGCTGTVNGTNAGATAEPDEPDHADGGGTRSVWYQWQAPFNGEAFITTSGSITAGGSQLDTVLAVYTGTAVNSLGTPVAQNDDEQPEQIFTSAVSFPVTSGNIYRIAVGGYNNGSGGDVGSITLHWFQDCNPWIPTAVDPSWVQLKTWTISGRTSGYIKLTFPDTGYRVGLWGVISAAGNVYSANAVIERFRGIPTPAITSTAQIYDLGPLNPGNYQFQFTSFGAVVKTIPFTVSATAPPPNPIDDAQEFVRWQYRDFLRREPDAPGLAHWTFEITQCDDVAFRRPGESREQCVDRKRENTSAAFFVSPEFSSTGYFVLRVYRGSLGRMPHYGGSGTAADEFTRDAATVGQGIVVNNALDPNVMNANKQAFVNEFVTRPEFRAIYDGLDNAQYVNKLFDTTGVIPNDSDRQALINGLNGGTLTRARVLFNVVDGTTTTTGGLLTFNTTYGKAFYDNLFNAAFVQMEYFGYLQRDPDPDGYAFWLGKLNLFGDWVNAEMVKAFIKSPEYRSRFVPQLP